MKGSAVGFKVVVVLWLILSACYVTYLVVERKNTFEIGGPEQKLQRIEEATDITQLKRTAKMYVDFMYGVHNASLRLWVVNLGYGVGNIVFLIYCVCCAGGFSSRCCVEKTAAHL